MKNPFDWLRAKTAAAVVAGFAEGLDRIERGDVAGLQERIAQALALPAPAVPAVASLAAASDGSPAPAEAAAAITTTEAPTRVKRGAK